MTGVWEDDPRCHWNGQGDWEEDIALSFSPYIGLNDALHNEDLSKAAMRWTQGNWLCGAS